MNRAKHGLTALGACLLASLALMAYAATAAEAAGEWSIDGKTMTELALSSAPLVGELESSSSFSISSTIGKTKEKISISCAKLEVKNGLLLKGGEATGEFLLSSCKTTIGEKESAACKPAEPVAMNERLLLILHGNRIFALVDPNGVGGILGAFKFSELCAVGEKASVTGTFVYECPKGKTGECNTSQVSHLLVANEEVAKMFKGQEEEKQVLPDDEVFFMNNPASWIDRVILRLAVAYEGHSWSGTV